MTTTVKVSAHCGDNKHVQVTVNENENVTVQQIENNQTCYFVVYDDKSVTVKEVNN